jgi:hypothetical protein
MRVSKWVGDVAKVIWQQSIYDVSDARGGLPVHNNSDNCGNRTPNPVSRQEPDQQVHRNVVAFAERAKQQFCPPVFKCPVRRRII